MNDVVAGEPLIQLIVMAYGAGLPVLTLGRHGVGKSDLYKAAARRLGIGTVIIDLSILEPPDLVGLPWIGEDGRTHYAPLDYLPRDGRGLFVLEELNRAPRYMRAPCLQLLTERKFNGYELPPGWLPCACINDAADGYDADELDEALLSRFVRARVTPDAVEWANWAERDGSVHPAVIAFVRMCPDSLQDPKANPRSWTYVGRALAAWESAELPQATLSDAVVGIVGDRWAAAFLRFFFAPQSCLTGTDILGGYASHRAAVAGWVRDRQMDLLRASLEALKRHVQAQHVYERLTPEQRANVEVFLADLPADLRQDYAAWLVGRGLRPPAPRTPAPPQRRRRTP